MVSTFVSPGELIGCDDVEPGNPYNLTVLHSLGNATLCTLTYSIILLLLLHIFFPFLRNICAL